MFALIFAVLIVGVLAGGIAAWLGQAKWRRKARRLDGELRSARQELDLINARQVYRNKPDVTPDPALPAIAPPLP